MTKNRIFPIDKEKLLVSDVSKSGLSVVFKSRKLVRYFKEGSLICFNSILPGDKEARMLVFVRHICTMDNKVMKVGFEIKDIDALSEANYTEFLDSVGLPPE